MRDIYTIGMCESTSDKDTHHLIALLIGRHNSIKFHVSYIPPDHPYIHLTCGAIGMAELARSNTSVFPPLIFSMSLNHVFFFLLQIIAFDELKTDYKNPIDQCNSLNPVSMFVVIIYVLWWHLTSYAKILCMS